MKNDVLLSCGCYRSFSPTPMDGDYLWCTHHGKGVHVKEGGTKQTGPGEYWNKCADCKYSRRHGNSSLSAEHKARLHREKNPTHTVIITAPNGEQYARYAPPSTNAEALF